MAIAMPSFYTSAEDSNTGPSVCATADISLTEPSPNFIVEFSLAMKKNEILTFSGKWMDLEIIAFSEISWTQEGK